MVNCYTRCMTESAGFIICAVFGSILLSMALHEAMHAFVSYWLGDDTAKYEGRLSLNPLRHIDPVLTVLMPLMFIVLNIGVFTSTHLPIFGAARPVPFDPRRVRWGDYGAALLAAAGPLTNLVLAGLGALGLRLFGFVEGQILSTFVLIFIEVNVGFFVFNMIPFPPLDGSRVLYALAPEGVRDLMRQIEAFGLTGIILFMFVGYQFLQPLILSINESILRFLLA
jgi:Zn-dependent protease